MSLMNPTTKAEAPFPLRRVFYLGVLPGLLLVIAAVVLATAQTVRSATTEILLQLASDKVDGIAKGIAAAAPEVWRKLLGGETALTRGTCPTCKSARR